MQSYDMMVNGREHADFETEGESLKSCKNEKSKEPRQAKYDNRCITKEVHKIIRQSKINGTKAIEEEHTHHDQYDIYIT